MHLLSRQIRRRARYESTSETVRYQPFYAAAQYAHQSHYPTKCAFGYSPDIPCERLVRNHVPLMAKKVFKQLELLGR
jgi:hypothetical protein